MFLLVINVTTNFQDYVIHESKIHWRQGLLTPPTIHLLGSLAWTPEVIAHTSVISHVDVHLLDV